MPYPKQRWLTDLYFIPYALSQASEGHHVAAGQVLRSMQSRPPAPARPPPPEYYLLSGAGSCGTVIADTAACSAAAAALALPDTTVTVASGQMGAGGVCRRLHSAAAFRPFVRALTAQRYARVRTHLMPHAIALYLLVAARTPLSHARGHRR